MRVRVRARERGEMTTEFGHGSSCACFAAALFLAPSVFICLFIYLSVYLLSPKSLHFFWLPVTVYLVYYIKSLPLNLAHTNMLKFRMTHLMNVRCTQNNQKFSSHTQKIIIRRKKTLFAPIETER